MNAIKDVILEILRECEVAENDLEDVNFIEHDILESLQIAEIVMEIEDRFEIEIDGDDIIPDNFINIDSIVRLVEKSKCVGVDLKGKNQIMWDMVARSANNSYEQSGWISSFTGNTFSEKEMREFVYNVKTKLSPYLTTMSTVIELGVGSGLIASDIAPGIKSYIGYDISAESIKRARVKFERQGIRNIELIQGDIRCIENWDRSANIVIINSVIQYLDSTEEYSKLISNIIEKMSPDIIFVGDIMDAEKRQEYLEELKRYKGRENKKDLWYKRSFIKSVAENSEYAIDTEITDKIGFTIQNELTKYRYDALYKIKR